MRLQAAGNGDPPSDDDVADWGLRIAKVEHGVLANCDPRGYLAIRTMILDEIDGDPRLDEFSRDAALLLAIEMGCMTAKESPFCAARA